MEPSNRNSYLPVTLCLLLCLLFLSFQGQANSETPTSFFDEELVEANLENLENNAVSVKDDPVVKAYVKAYLQRHRKKSQQILGRALLYFPLFEDYLKAHNLPEDIKYLAIVESALDPKAISRVGAVGLWQFMPGTGVENGLDINYYVDERRDPDKSTLAAIKYLTKLYERYDDWALALAAYNSGPGRVNRAIRRGRSKDFWRIRRYLPRETRNYVPAFLAVTYLVKHYAEHGLEPEYPTLDEQLTETVTIHDSYSFYEIAQITELPIETIEFLNPSFKHQFIPADKDGYSLRLPKRSLTAFTDFMEFRSPVKVKDFPLTNKVNNDKLSEEEVNKNYYSSVYIVRKDEDLESIAKELQFKAIQLKAWNNLKEDTLAEGQQLTLFFPKEIKRFYIREPFESFASLPQNKVPLGLAVKNEWVRPNVPIVYNIKIRKKTDEVPEEIPGIDIVKIHELNNWGYRQTLKQGTTIILGRR